MRFWTVTVGTLVITILMFGGQPAGAQLINPFSRDAVNLSESDREAMRSAIRRALDSGVAGTQETWTSEDGETTGLAILTRTFDDDGASCGEVEHLFTAGPGKGRHYLLPFCKQPDGSWKLAF